MELLSGVYVAKKKDGTVYYRANITFSGKHISLGSHENVAVANAIYNDAREILYGNQTISDYTSNYAISFKKFVTLINFRDNGIYIKTPIYIEKKFFTYYLDVDDYLIFDVDDLFYYSTHSIMRRKNHLFVADYGMQVNILSRYGIRSHAVCGRDYYFSNGDTRDFTYGNIIIQNKYHGVVHYIKNGRDIYKATIHIVGDYVIGKYRTEEEAAVAYNKAADILKKAGIKKSFPENYPESLSAISYASIYNSVRISEKILNYKP